MCNATCYIQVMNIREMGRGAPNPISKLADSLTKAFNITISGTLWGVLAPCKMKMLMGDLSAIVKKSTSTTPGSGRVYPCIPGTDRSSKSCM